MKRSVVIVTEELMQVDTEEIAKHWRCKVPTEQIGALGLTNDEMRFAAQKY